MVMEFSRRRYVCTSIWILFSKILHKHGRTYCRAWGSLSSPKFSNSARLTSYSSSKNTKFDSWFEFFTCSLFFIVRVQYKYALYFRCSFAHQTLIVIHWKFVKAHWIHIIKFKFKPEPQWRRQGEQGKRPQTLKICKGWRTAHASASSETR